MQLADEGNRVHVAAADRWDGPETLRAGTALRVGIAIRGDAPTPLERELAGAVVALPFVAELVLLVDFESRATDAYGAASSSAVDAVYRAVDRWRDAWPDEEPPLPGDSQRLNTKPVQTGTRGAYSGVTFDVGLHLEGVEPAGLPRARAGWWMVACSAFGDGATGLAGFARLPLNGGTLQCVLRAPAGVGQEYALLVSGAARSPSRFSAAKNRHVAARLSRSVVACGLSRLHALGWPGLQTRAGRFLPDVSPPRVHRTRSHARLFAGMVLQHLRTRWQPLRESVEEWRVAVRWGDSGREGALPSNTTGFRFVVPRPGTTLADPLAIFAAGREWLFMEEWDECAGKGRIVYVAFGADGTVGGIAPALERPYHLSHPIVFRHRGDWYMIPESGAQRTVELYRAKAFPADWELVRVLARGPYYDTTVLHRDDRFWFFNTRLDDCFGCAAELHLYSARDLEGEWESHPLNPISIDIRHARSAGPIVQAGGELLRPVQDSSVDYGRRVLFRRIVRLDVQDYAEETVEELTAQSVPGATGLHFYARAGRLEAIDVRVPKKMPYGALLA